MKILYFILFFLTPFVLAIKEVRLDITTEKKDKRAAIRQAVNQASREFVETFLGQDKYQKDQKTITEKIIKNQNRYIVFSKSSPFKVGDDGRFQTTVTLGISEENLKSLLLEHNLFYESLASLCVLPVISFSLERDKEKEIYSWWFSEKGSRLAATLSADFFDALSSHVIDSGFYGLDPVFSRLQESVPDFVFSRQEKISNIKSLAEFLKCHIVLSGRVSLKENKKTGALISYFEFKVFNVQTHQVLFKMRKKILVPGKRGIPLSDSNLKKAFSEVSRRILSSISHQLSAYRAKGALDLSRLFLAIQGPLTYFQREAFEKFLVRHVASIKSLQKRYMASGKTVYEMESDKSIAQLSDIVKTSAPPGYHIKVIAYNKKQLEIYVKKTDTIR